MQFRRGSAAEIARSCRVENRKQCLRASRSSIKKKIYVCICTRHRNSTGGSTPFAIRRVTYECRELARTLFGFISFLRDSLSPASFSSAETKFQSDGILGRSASCQASATRIYITSGFGSEPERARARALDSTSTCFLLRLVSLSRSSAAI